jgi:lipoprotein-releasing system permease protein
LKGRGRSRFFLPLEWWKLSLLWFSNLKSRTPRARRGLFQTSLKVAALSLSLGVGALSVTLAIVTGFEWTLAKSVYQTQGHVLHLSHRWRSFAQMEKFASLAPSGVDHAEFFWSSYGLVVGPKGGRGVLIEGRRRAGTTAHDRHYNEVHLKLGKPLADYLGVKKGGQVRIVLPKIIKGSIVAKVDDLVSNGMYEIDSRMVIVNDESLRSVMRERDPESFASRPGDAIGIRYFLKPGFGPEGMDRLEAWTAQYKAAVLKYDKNNVDGHKFVNWREQKSSVFRGIGYNKIELTLVVSLLTLVAALNVAATLVVLFLERDREVAILQALGLSPNQTLQWIGIQGILLGLVSAVVGLALGRIFGWGLVRMPFAQLPEDIYNIGRLPLKFEFWEQLRVFAFGIGAALMAALMLGLRLSRINLVTLLGQRR